MSTSRRTTGIRLAVAAASLVVALGCTASDAPAGDGDAPDAAAADAPDDADEPGTDARGADQGAAAGSDLEPAEEPRDEPADEPEAEGPRRVAVVDVADVDDLPELVAFAQDVGLPVFVPVYDEAPGTTSDGHPLVTTTIEEATARNVSSLVASIMQGAGWEAFGFPPDEDGRIIIRAITDGAEVTYAVVEVDDEPGRVETVVETSR